MALVQPDGIFRRLAQILGVGAVVHDAVIPSDPQGFRAGAPRCPAATLDRPSGRAGELVTRALGRRTAADRLHARPRLPTRLVVPGRGHLGRGRGHGGGALRPAPGAAPGTHHDLGRPPRHRGEVSSPTTDAPSRVPLDRGRPGVTCPLLRRRNRSWRVSYDSLARGGCDELVAGAIRDIALAIARL